MPLSSRGSIAFYATIEFFSPFIRFEQALVWHAHHFDVKKNQKKSKKKKKIALTHEIPWNVSAEASAVRLQYEFFFSLHNFLQLRTDGHVDRQSIETYVRRTHCRFVLIYVALIIITVK